MEKNDIKITDALVQKLEPELNNEIVSDPYEVRERLKKFLKPRLPIIETLVSLCLYAYLLIDVIQGNYDRLLLTSVLVPLGLIPVGYAWARYYYIKKVWKDFK